jgi:hypothetical protein
VLLTGLVLGLLVDLLDVGPRFWQYPSHAALELLEIDVVSLEPNARQSSAVSLRSKI